MPGASSAAGARRLLVATRSQHKLRELRELLGVGPEVELVRRTTSASRASPTRPG